MKIIWFLSILLAATVSKAEDLAGPNTRTIDLGYKVIDTVPDARTDKDYRKEMREKAVEFVKMGYGDILIDSAFRSLHFRTECLETSEIQPAISVVTSYNSFQGEKVANALTKYKGLIECYEFGREGDPILVIKLPYWTHQREGQDPHKRGTRISDSEHKHLVEKIEQDFKTNLAVEEVHADKIEERKIYLIWD